MTERAAPSVDGLVIGILGGTGDHGRGLAFRFARAGHPVIIGSRLQERARTVASLLGHNVQGMANRDTAVRSRPSPRT
jgi:8-hydroxy-5-deazaflavin:NADPH oxidoreductase